MKVNGRVWPGLIMAVLLLMVFSGCRSQYPVNFSSNGRLNANIVTFHVTGKGLAPETAISKGQADLMAERAAVADGYRQLVEKIRGVYVDAYMRSGRGSVDYEMIRTSTQAWLRGAEVDDIVKTDNDITEAHMTLRVNFVRKNMMWWPSGMASNSVSVPGSPSSGIPRYSR